MGKFLTNGKALNFRILGSFLCWEPLESIFPHHFPWTN